MTSPSGTWKGVTVPQSQRCTLVPTLILFSAVSGCATAPAPVDEQARQRLLNFLLPDHIEIVEPFTRVSSFDEDSTPEGIELFLRAVNALGNPGLMIAGHIRIELYEYVPASGVPQGKRYAVWEVDLKTEKQQRTYWNQLTQMYEFRLAVDRAQIPPADAYWLLVTYDSPFGTRLTDEFVIHYRSAAGLPHPDRGASGAR